MPKKKEIREEWYKSFTCSQCAHIRPVTDRFTRVVDNSPILGFCPVLGHCVFMDKKAKECFKRR